MQFLRHNWRNKSDIDDLRQDVYVRVCEAAQKEIPATDAKPFVFATARNLLIDRVRREQIVPIEAVADLDALDIAADEPGPDRSVIARDELRRVAGRARSTAAALPRGACCCAVEGLSRREIASAHGHHRRHRHRHLADGMRALADALYGEDARMSGAPQRADRLPTRQISKRAPPIGSSSAAIARTGARTIRPHSMPGSRNRPRISVAYWRLDAAWDRTERLARCARPRPKRAGARASCRCCLKIAAAFAVVAVLGAAATQLSAQPRDAHFLHAGGRARNRELRRRHRNRTQHRHGPARAHDDGRAHRLARQGRSLFPGQARCRPILSS